MWRVTLVLVLAGIAVAVSGVVGAGRLPEDPARRCAAKALRGDFGPLSEWQKRGYTALLNGKPRYRRAWVTTYYPEEGFGRGDECRWWSAGCSERVAAANKLPAYAWVWVWPGHLRQVLDTGARRNDVIAARKGADLWLDLWEPKRGTLFGDDNAGVRVIAHVGPGKEVCYR